MIAMKEGRIGLFFSKKHKRKAVDIYLENEYTYKAKVETNNEIL